MREQREIMTEEKEVRGKKGRKESRGLKTSAQPKISLKGEVKWNALQASERLTNSKSFRLLRNKLILKQTREAARTKTDGRTDVQADKELEIERTVSNKLTSKRNISTSSGTKAKEQNRKLELFRQE